MIGRPRARLKTRNADICIIIDQLRAPGKCRKSGALCLIFRYIFCKNGISSPGMAPRLGRAVRPETIRSFSFCRLQYVRP